MDETEVDDDADVEVVAGMVIARLAEEGATLATAESLTGGRLARVLTDIAGASEVFVGGVVTYTSRLKEELLGVPSEVIDGPGVVSAECAEAMAEGVRRLTGSTYALSTTGVAGPGLQEGKPVGTVFVALAAPDGTAVRRTSLSGNRASIRRDSCVAALTTLVDRLDGTRPDPSGQESGRLG